jgi:hypothetical protein
VNCFILTVYKYNWNPSRFVVKGNTIFYHENPYTDGHYDVIGVRLERMEIGRSWGSVPPDPRKSERLHMSSFQHGIWRPSFARFTNITNKPEAPVSRSSCFLGDPPPDPRFLASLGALSLLELDHRTVFEILASWTGPNDLLLGHLLV